MREPRLILRILVSGLFLYGVFSGLKRGGEDFRVFHHAASLVLSGRGDAIYVDSPDRFLYSPGVAWLFAPFALTSWKSAFLLWNLLKGWIFWKLLQRMAARWGEQAALLSVIFFARPLLIELRYGQVNLLILGGSYLFLDSYFDALVKQTRNLTTAAASGWAALTKIFPAAVIGVPFFGVLLDPDRQMRRRALQVIGAAAVAALLISALPVLTQGFEGTTKLHLNWIGALRAKGFPIDTHNQSFAGFLFHAFGQEVYYSITLGPGQSGMRGLGWISLSALERIGWGVTLGGLLTLVALAAGIARSRAFTWSPLLVAGLILPSHLIWKPYFVLGLPLIAQTLSLLQASDRSEKILLVLAFCGLNLTTLDILGAQGAAWFEAMAGLFWSYLLAILINVRLNLRKA